MADIRKIVLDYLATGEKRKYSEDAQPVLQRIAASRAAQPALNTIADSEGDIRYLIQQCIHAKTVQGTFTESLAEKRKIEERLQRHRKSVIDLRQFIQQATRWPEDPIVGLMPLSETEQERVDRQNSVFKRTEVLTGQQQPPPDAYEKTAGYYRNALDRIALLIGKRQETTERTMLTYAATRKSKAKTAAENSAIGFLANRVANLTGKPHARHVAALAEAALGISEVTEDRAREAAKMRRRKLVYSTNK
jgi:hypothetical protein